MSPAALARQREVRRLDPVRVALPQPGDKVKIDYPGYVLHGKTVMVISCARERLPPTNYRRLATPPPTVVFQNPLAPNVQIGLSLTKVVRV